MNDERSYTERYEEEFPILLPIEIHEVKRSSKFEYEHGMNFISDAEQS